MKGTKKIFNALLGDPDLQSPKSQRSIRRLRTLISEAEGKSGYVFTHRLYTEISAKCNYLQSQTSNVGNKKALRIIQGSFDRTDHEELYLYESDELIDSAARDSWESFSDD